MNERSKSRPAFQDVLGVSMNDPELLTQALTHSSYVNENENAGGLQDNERLEFLGDAVLDLIVADLLYRRYPDMSEGELTQLRASLVKTESLARLGADCGIGEYLRVGHGEELSGGRERGTILCRAYEAVIGAIFLDRGLRAVTRFATPPLLALLEHILAHNLHLDARSQLQEQAQAKLNIAPSYRVAHSEGPEHAKAFHVEVAIGGEILGRGVGRSKRAAAQDAARAALDAIQREGLPSSP